MLATATWTSTRRRAGPAARRAPAALTAATGGAGATGGNGGNGQGGGIFVDGASPFGTPDVALIGCTVEFNEADGGAAGAGGSGGQGIGGGVYNLGTFSYDAATTIALNVASTSNDDIYP